MKVVVYLKADSTAQTVTCDLLHYCSRTLVSTIKWIGYRLQRVSSSHHTAEFSTGRFRAYTSRSCFFLVGGWRRPEPEVGSKGNPAEAGSLFRRCQSTSDLSHIRIAIQLTRLPVPPQWRRPAICHQPSAIRACSNVARALACYEP